MNYKMGSVLQFAAFLCICCLIRTVVTHPNQDEDKRFNNKRSNTNDPAVGDFYFVEEKANDDNVKNGRAIPQSAWSKQDKEPTVPVENKTGTQFSDDFSIQKFLSYLLNAVHELKEDIFGIKEIASLKKTKELPNSEDNFEDKGKQNKMGGNHDEPKPDDLTENTEFRKENQQPTLNYITDYYQKNGFKFTDDEEKDDDLENSSDVSDDSSHKPNEGTNIHEVSKKNDNTHNFKCMKIKRKPDKYSFESKKTTTIPTSQTKIPDEGVKEFDESKKRGKYDDFKESTTTKPEKPEENHSKASREETENGSALPSSSKTGKCTKKNKDSINNLNEKKEPTEKPLKYAEYVTVASPQNENSDQEESKRSNQDKTVDNRSPGKNSKNKDGSDFDNKPGVLIQSTTLSPQSSKDVTFPEDENEPHASGMASKNPTYRKQDKQTTSPKPEDQKRTQNNAKSPKDTDGINEHTTVSSQSNKPVLEIPKHEMSTAAYTSDTEINNSPKESKGKGSKVISTQTIVTYNENEPNSKIDKQQTSNSFDIGNTVAPTTSGNMNTDNLNKDPSDSLSEKKGTNENDESEKSSAIKQDKNDSETQGDSETEVQEVNDDSEPEKSLKNKKLNDSNPGNNNKDEDDNLTSGTTNDLLSQDSNHEIQNHDIKGSDKPQETQKNNENLNKRTGMQEISPDQEYEFEEDKEDFDISDELSDTQDFDQNQAGELNANNGDYEDDDEINPGNTETVLTNESQISQHTGYVMEEKSQEQYDTFLEYFYKHSNNSYFQSLKNHSNNFSGD